MGVHSAGNRNKSQHTVCLLTYTQVGQVQTSITHGQGRPQQRAPTPRLLSRTNFYALNLSPPDSLPLYCVYLHYTQGGWKIHVLL